MGEQMENGEITDAQVCNEILVGWSGIVDDDNKEIKFSKGALQQLIDVPMVATGIATAYFNSLAGIKRKN